MLLGFVHLHEPGRIELGAPLRVLGGGSELVQVDTRPETEEDGRARTGLHHVVRLVLRVVEPEDLARVPGSRMALQGEVTAAERVQVVEANRERPAEALGDVDAEHLLALLSHEELETDLERRLEPEEDPALRRDELVRPGEVRRVGLDPQCPS